MEAESLLVSGILQQLDNGLKMASLCWARWNHRVTQVFSGTFLSV